MNSRNKLLEPRRNYRQGPIFTTIYGASGSSVDYHYSESGVTLAYEGELTLSHP